MPVGGNCNVAVDVHDLAVSLAVNMAHLLAVVHTLSIASRSLADTTST